MAVAPTHVSDAGTPPPGIGSSAYLPELEGLRGLAILLVVAFHCHSVACGIAREDACGRAPLALIGAGHTGVGLFFVLSAFLLSLPFLRESAGGAKVSRWRFYQRRALRILPLYWGVLAVGMILSPSTETAWRTLPYVLFVNGVWPSPPAGMHTHVMWSLATEVQFYALLPLMFHLVGTRSLRPLGALVLVGFVLAYLALVAGILPGFAGAGWWLVGASILGRGPVFLCGIAAAWIYLRFGGRLRAWRPLAVGGGDLILLASLIALEVLLRAVGAGDDRWETGPYVAWHVAEGMLWALVLLALVVTPLRLRAVFANAVMIRLGVLSYSIYLLHYPLLLWAGPLLRTPPVLATGLGALPGVYLLAVACVGLAALTYRFVERPFLMRKARVGDVIPGPVSSGRPEPAAA
jgi:peptidoglycan/LPS O-acetylase OafA/YrhL